MANILLVDDEPDMVTLIKMILEREGHFVETAKDSTECFEKLKKKTPDLILLDVMMPGMDGWEVAKKIREDSAYKDVIISMLTVKSDNEDKIKSLTDAHSWHISKPVSREKLLQVVDWLLKRPFVCNWDNYLNQFTGEQEKK